MNARVLDLCLLTPVFVLRALHLAVIHQHEPFLDFLLGFAAGTEYLDLQNDLGQVRHWKIVWALGQDSQCDF